MADATGNDDVGTTEIKPDGVAAVGEAAENAAAPVESLSNKIYVLSKRLAEMNKMLGLKNVPAGFKSVSDSVNKADKDVASASSSMVGGFAASISRLVDGAVEAGKTIKQNLSKNSSELEKSFLKTMPKLIGLKIAVEGLDQIKGLNPLLLQIEKSNKEMAKSSMQMSLGMGQGFDNAQSNVAGYRDMVVSSLLDTKASMEDIIASKDAFKDAFAANEIAVNLGELSSAFKEVSGNHNLMNISLLAGAATGMKSADIAGMMATAHTELGASLSESATMLGQISTSAEKAGISFNKVSASIMKGADSLKLWGGTIGSVTPLYDMFSSSLEKGRKGLAPELMEKYVSGIANMGFEMKAFIGMATGGDAAGGALGAGLEMEELLGKGAEGTMEISEKIKAMVEERSGGEIITRKEAAAGGAEGAKQYEMQNRLIQQAMGMDRKMANETMNALRGLDDQGEAVDGKDQLGKLLSQGQSVQDRTTDAVTEAGKMVEAAVYTSGEDVIKEISVSAAKIFEGRDTKLRQAARGVARTGKVDGDTLSSITAALRGQRNVQSTMDQLGVRGSQARAEVTSGVAKGSQIGDNVMAGLNADMERRRMTMLKDPSLKGKKQLRAGNVDNSMFMEDYQKRLDQVGGEINSLLTGEGGKQINKRDLGSEDKAQLRTLEKIEDAIKQRMGAEKIDMGQYNRRQARQTIERGDAPAQGMIELGQPVIGGAGAEGPDAIDQIMAGGGIPLSLLGNISGPGQMGGGLEGDLKKYGLLDKSDAALEPPTAIRTAEGGFDFGAEGVAAPGQEDLSNTINSIAASMEALAPGSTGNLKAGLPVEEAMAATEGVKRERIKLEFAESEPLEQKVNFHFEQTGDGTYRAVVDEVATAKIVRKIQNEGR